MSGLDGCTGLCPPCCAETIAEIEAHTNAGLRNRALTLSSVLVVLYAIVHICYFIHCEKELPVPDFVWAIILAPWVGASADKLARIVKGGKK